ncbi:hypothetical protein BH23BAC1_BH23BAC1_26920 [soil metagenome]
MKNIEDLKAEEKRIQQMLDDGIAEQLKQIPGVVHVSVGLKQIHGVATDEFSIRIYVDKKKKKADLPQDQLIPPIINGVKTDINEIDIARPLLDTAKYRPVKGGIQITNGINGNGTLGCFATRNSDGTDVLLTNHHVIGGTAGTSVFQPTNTPADKIGTVITGLVDGNVDSAIASIDAGISIDDDINTLNINGSSRVAGVATPVAGMYVYKVGRTTGRTYGKIIDANAATAVDYATVGGGLENFTNQLMIQAVKNSKCCCCECQTVDSSLKFSDQGDSGSVVVNESRMAVGLLFADNDGDPNVSYANRMTEVENTLDITIHRTIVVPSVASISANEHEPVLITADNQVILEDLEKRFNETEQGRTITKIVMAHRAEVIHLINHNRTVMVTWQRYQGPAYVVHFLNSARDGSYKIPPEVKGVNLSSLLINMAAVMKQHGSDTLKASINQYGLDIIHFAEDADSIEAMLDKTKRPLEV